MPREKQKTGQPVENGTSIAAAQPGLQIVSLTAWQEATMGFANPFRMRSKAAPCRFRFVALRVLRF